MGVARIFSEGGNTFSKNFQKICKKIFIKFSKDFVKIFKKLKKIQKYSTQFQKNYKNFVNKIAKNGFLIIVFKKFKKPSIQFLRVWTLNAICRKF